MSGSDNRLSDAARAIPLVAILRGLAPQTAASIAGILVDAGLRIIEVPLNGARALDTIVAIKGAVPANVVVGAGTVLTSDDARSAAKAGAELLVMPNTNWRVMEEGRTLGLALMPGVVTPSEAFAALEMGAHALKLFPAEIVGPQGLRALRSVLPKAAIYAVGGVTPETLRDWYEAGADGFGIGGALYKPEFDESEIRSRAGTFVRAWRALGGQSDRR